MARETSIDCSNNARCTGILTAVPGTYFAHHNDAGFRVFNVARPFVRVRSCRMRFRLMKVLFPGAWIF